MKRFKEHYIDGDSDCTVITEIQDAIATSKRLLQADKVIIRDFINVHPEWEKSLVPIRTQDAPQIIVEMEIAAETSGVGPMAAIAGVLADRMKDKMVLDHQVKIAVVENGGEIICTSTEDIIIGLYVLTTALKAQLGFKFPGGAPDLGIGTSSGQFGHAFSMGEADAVTVFADTAGLADAAATRVCNAVKGDDYEAAILTALEVCDDISGVRGAFIARKGFIGQKGHLPPLVKIKDGEKTILEEKFRPV